MADFTLRPMTIPERKYTYAQSSQLQGQTGNIGYLRGDFGSSGDQFYTTWFDTRPQWKSDEFKRDLDDVINALRSEEYGLLQSRSQMVRYGRENKESEMQGAYTTEFGFRADTEKYAFVLRCNPTRGDYNFYCLCYVKEWLDKHIEEGNFFLLRKNNNEPKKKQRKKKDKSVSRHEKISVIWKDNHFDYTPDLMTSWTVGNVFSGSNRDTWQTSVPYFLKGKEVKQYGKQKFKLFGANWKDHFYCVREAVGNR